MKHLSVSAQARRRMREIQIYTRRLLRGFLIGDGRSAIRGSGFEFDQIREYREGDDIRFIDWKASARSNQLLLKEYIEERSRRIILCVDVSKSSSFGSGSQTKADFMAEVAAVIALVSDNRKDRVGLVLFSDEVEFYLPPGRGLQHVHVIMEYLLGYTSSRSGTSIGSVLKWLGRFSWRDAVICILSDFIDTGADYSQQLVHIAKRHDLVALRIFDKRERFIPSVGLVTVQDSETGELVLLDTRKSHNGHINSCLREWHERQDYMFKRSGVDLLDLPTDRSFALDLMRFFRKRTRL